MQPLVIDNPRIIELAQRAARRRNGTVEEALIDVLSKDVETTPLDLPDAETLAAQHGITIDEAMKLIRDATWREWTMDDVTAEIAWLHLVRDNPDVEKRKLPGMKEHWLRITRLPEAEKQRLAALPHHDDLLYDEFGLPK